MKKVIITGATGFIGYALTKRLRKKGVKVYAIVRKNSSNEHKLDKMHNVEIIHCDLKHMDELPTILQERDFDVFIHLAWQGVSDEDSWSQDIQLSNVKASCDAVKAASELGCKRFIFAASIMEYEVIKLMQTEICAGIRNLYRIAKLSAHYMTRVLGNQYLIPYNAIIIGNVYGAGEISERFINSTLRKMLNGERVKFTKAQQLYDFIYIDDALDMIEAVAEKGKYNKDYYIGNMTPRKLEQYIYEMRNCVDETLEIGLGESSEYIGVSLTYQELDIYACREDFGLIPQYSFEEGIRKTIDWIRGIKNEDSYSCSSDI